MKAKDMREKSSEDLAELEKSLVKDAFQARFKNFTARLDDTSALKKARRDIARVRTILTQRTKSAPAAEVAAPAKPAPKAKAVKAAPAKAKTATKKATATATATKKSSSEATK
jgi:large subunit ribosomal protein L29